MHFSLLQITVVDFVKKKANFTLFDETALITILRQAYSEVPIHLILNQSWLILTPLLDKTLDKMCYVCNIFTTWKGITSLSSLGVSLGLY